MSAAFQITNQAPGTVDITLYQAIGDPLAAAIFPEEFVDAQTVASYLAEAEGANTINVYMKSPGGLVEEGLAIYEMLSRQKATVNTIIDGEVASIASIIALAGHGSGKNRRMAGSATFFIHTAQGLPSDRPTARHLRKTAEEIDKVNERLRDIYATRSKMSQQEVEELMTDEGTTLRAEEALERGLVDKITNPLMTASEALREGVISSITSPAQVYALYQRPSEDSLFAPRAQRTQNEPTSHMDIATINAALGTNCTTAEELKQEIENRRQQAYNEGYQAGQKSQPSSGTEPQAIAQAFEAAVAEEHRPAFRALMQAGDFEHARQYIAQQNIIDARELFANKSSDPNAAAGKQPLEFQSFDALYEAGYSAMKAAYDQNPEHFKDLYQAKFPNIPRELIKPEQIV
jgi:ATP-dependent Clp endopeptidase proteolytic subunit ClpP